MSESALGHIKVLDLSHALAGAYCAKLLAALGAETIKVEPPNGDSVRSWGPFPQDVPDQELGGLFHYLNVNKRGLTLDFTKATGREILERLVAQTDVVVLDYQPKEAVALGLTFEQLRKVNPRLVLTSVTPFGVTGPWADYAASDLTVVEMSGMGKGTPPRIADPENESPLRPGPRQSEFLGGINAAAATVHGLMARQSLGQAIMVDVSQQEAMAALSLFNLGALSYEDTVPKRTDGGGTMGPLVQCKDGMVCVMTVYEHQWRAWLSIVGLSEEKSAELLAAATGSAQVQHLLSPIVQEWARMRTRAEVLAATRAARVPSEPVLSIAEVSQTEHLAFRQYFASVERRGKQIKFPGASFRLSETPWEIRRQAPRLGEHNEEILVGQLGYTRGDLSKMKNAGVI